MAIAVEAGVVRDRDNGAMWSALVSVGLPVAGAVAAFAGAAYASWVSHRRELRSELFLEYLPSLGRSRPDRVLNRDLVSMLALRAYAIGGLARYRAEILLDLEFMARRPENPSIQDRYPAIPGITSIEGKNDWIVEQALVRGYGPLNRLISFQLQPWWWRLFHLLPELQRRWKLWRSESEFRTSRSGWTRV